MSKPQVSTHSWTIQRLYDDFYKPGQLVFNTEYQRSEVWNLSRKQKLIDSIIKQYNLGMIFLRRKGDLYEVLDGQQRLKAIFDFINNEYSTSAEFTPEIGEMDFETLGEDKNRYSRFFAFDLIIALVENADDETTSDIFLRLQEGMPLNTAEKLNAMRGKMHNIILDLSNYPFIKNTGIKDHRFAHRLLAAQIFALELNSNFDLMDFHDINFQSLKDMYEKYSIKNPPAYAISNTKKYLNFLGRSFGDKAQIIRRRGDFIPIYLLYSYLEKKYATQGIEEIFVDFTMNFLNKVESTNIKDVSVSLKDKPYHDFKRWRSTGALSSKSFRERFKIILGKFLEESPSIELKDKTRAFDYGQKLAIYYKDKGICQKCHKEISFDEVEIDHINPWSKAGPTTVNNGQLLCQECNRKKGNKSY